VGFHNDPEAARSAINDAVNQATKGKITDLMPQGSIDPSTVAVLTNASYLKAPWLEPFEPQLTKPGVFHTLTGDHTAQFMHNPQLEAASSATSDQYQAVQLPYAGQRLAALFVEPRTGDLTALARDLGASGDAGSILGALEPGPVDLSLPKIEVKQAL